MSSKKTKSGLEWTYCECGCHGAEIRIGGLYFWSIVEFPYLDDSTDEYREPVIHLNNGHKWGEHLGTFKSYKELNVFVTDLVKDQIKEMKKAIRKR